MASHHEIAARIDAIEDIGSLLHGLKTLSAVTAHQFENYRAILSDFQETNRLSLKCLGAQTLNVLPEPENDPKQTTLMIAGPERGFCGRIRDHLIETLRCRQAAQTEAPLMISVGSSLTRRLEENGISPASAFTLPASTNALEAIISSALETHIDRSLASESSEIRCIYPVYEKTTGLRIIDERIWPPGKDDMERAVDQPWPSKCIPRPLGDTMILRRFTLRQKIYTDLLKVLILTLIAEHTSRLTTLEATERNIEETLSELSLEANRQRQKAITEELIELRASFKRRDAAH